MEILSSILVIHSTNRRNEVPFENQLKFEANTRLTTFTRLAETVKQYLHSFLPMTNSGQLFLIVDFKATGPWFQLSH